VGLYKQPNLWSCGPFALKHALVVLGRMADERRIARVARSDWWSGTDEVRLARAARAFDCTMTLVRRTDEELARRALVRCLNQRFPALLCVDDWQHWIVAVHYERGRFVVIDSREDPVLVVYTWEELEARWRYEDEEEDDEEVVVYDLHPVKPKFRRSVVGRFSLARARFLRRPENLDLARHWDEYLEDLLDICRPRSARTTEALSMAEFLRRHRSVIVQRITHWHGGVKRDRLERLLRNLRFVADTYAMVIPAAATRRALVDLSAIAMLWAAAKEGVSPMYGSSRAVNRAQQRR
jgi:hypothetical protein